MEKQMKQIRFVANKKYYNRITEYCYDKKKYVRIYGFICVFIIAIMCISVPCFQPFPPREKSNLFCYVQVTSILLVRDSVNWLVDWFSQIDQEYFFKSVAYVCLILFFGGGILYSLKKQK